ncbi:hypothetical protein AAVH_13916 [Aphelenchoides avenae]|nr:hypothetical protein AAVH_13916 [Aphelenchus avenae]
MDEDTLQGMRALREQIDDPEVKQAISELEGQLTAEHPHLQEQLYPNATDHSETNGHNKEDGKHKDGHELDLGTVEDHFAFFRAIYDKVNEYIVVKKVRECYEQTKHTSPKVERTAERLEVQLSEMSLIAAPLYENYVYPSVDRLLHAYYRGVCASKATVAKTKAVAETTTAASVAVAVLAAQLGLLASLTATNLVLDGAIRVKNGLFSGGAKKFE